MKQSEKTTMIFDFGRVLVDWDPRYLYRKLLSDDQAIEAFLEEVHFYEWVLLQDAGRPVADTVNEWCRRYPHRCDLLRAYDQRYPETILGPIDGSVAILRCLKDAGYPVWGLSNWPIEKFRLLEHKFEFFSWLDGKVISGEVGIAKPDPAIYHLLLQQAGRQARDCLLIDDSATNIAVAHQLGFQTILFQSPQQLQDELIQHTGTSFTASPC
jgi:2-haloacid dehalogenase